jgi:nucleoid-associated protein YgaU
MAEVEKIDKARKTEQDLAAQRESLASSMQQQQQAMAAAAAAASSASPSAPVITHVWTKEDTYASLAQKYYGSIQEPYWRLIYDHNKAVIGNHPNNIRVGLEIEIPPLPDSLKK